MNAINSSSTTQNTSPFRLDTSKQSAFSGVKAGDIISGTLTAFEGKKAVITMENGTSFQVDKNSIAADIGQKVSFEVADVHGNSVVMKQINEQKQEEIGEREKSADLKGDELLNWAKGATLPITGRAFESSKIMYEELAAENAKIQDALNKIRRDILHSVNNVSSGAISLLAANGVSAQGITVTMLSEAIKSAVSAGAPVDMPHDATAEQELAAALESYAKNNDMAKNAQDIINALLSEELPPTDTNISGLSGVCDKLSETEGMSFADKISFLRRQQEPTVNNLFTAMHSAGGSNKIKQMTDSEWENVRPAVEKYMDSSGIQKTAENLNAARALIANDIPVTEENIGFLNGSSKRADTAEILRKAARNMAEGKSPLNVNVYGERVSFNAAELFDGYKDIIEKLPKITDNAIFASVDSGEPVTVSALINAQRNIDSGNGRQGENNNHTESIISERIKLEELRLRLTVSAASQMARAGISIDAMELQSAIEALKGVENGSNAAALKIAGAAASVENVAEMSERMSKIRSLSNTYDSVKRAILQKEIEFTAEKVSAANESARERAARDGYDAASTAPNAKFGDSIQKALSRVENLLEALGIEAAPENVKAARSLVRTGTDVTRENIEAVKAINNKLEFVVNNLHPVISAQMIKDGFNPLTAHIDEAISYINKFSEIYGEPPVESVEKAILTMDKNGALSKEERTSLIGAYRMMSAISRNEMAASAVIAKSGKSLTLENLMEAGKYYDKSKSRKSVIDRAVDDTDGGRELVFPQATIKQQIESGYRAALNELSESGVAEDTAISAANEFNLGLTAENMLMMAAVNDTDTELAGENINAAANIKYNIDSFMAEAKSNAALEYLKNIGEELDKTDIRNLLDGMRQFMAENSKNEARLNSSEAASFRTFKDDVKSLAQVSPQQIAWMLEMNLPLTISNIKAVCGMSADRNYLGKRIEEINKQAEEIAEANALDAIPDTDLKPLIENGADGVMDSIGARLEELAEKALDSDSAQKIELINRASVVESAARVMRQADGKYYQIPVKLHDKIGSLNVFVLNEEADADNMSAFLQLDLTELGVVQGTVNITDGFADIVIGAEGESAAELLSRNADILDGYISELGLDGYSISFKREEKLSRFADETPSAKSGAINTGAAKPADGLLDIKL